MAKKDSRQNKKSKFEQERECYYEVTLDNEQIEAAQKIKDNDISILVGKAGSGKTYLACAVALQMLLKGEVEKIILTRSTVSQDALGYLPGTLTDKYLPYLCPLLVNFEKMYSKPHIDAFLNNGKIEMIPLQFTRGITYDNAVVIIDESQNLDSKQLKMCMSRLGDNSKVIITGDLQQVDFKRYSDSGLPKVLKFNIEGYCVIELQNEHRKQIVIDILNEFEKIGV